MGKRLLTVCIVICLAVTLPVFSYAGYINQIPISTDANGNIYNGIGYKSGYRLNSSGVDSAMAGCYVTGFIPVDLGDEVYFENVTYQAGVTSGVASGNQRISFYDSNKSYINQLDANQVKSSISSVFNSSNICEQLTVENWSGADISAVAYFRIAASYIGSDSVIAVNQNPADYYSVSVSSSGNGTVSVSDSMPMAGELVTLTAIPNDGYYLKEWQVISGGVTISNNKFTMPDADVSVKAVFAPIEYDISVSSSSGGTASANLSKATYGQTVSLTATPADGYTFSEWEVTSGNASVINNQFIMPRGDVSVKAVFLPIPVYSVTVESSGNGVASANPTSGYAGTAVTLSAVPALGYEFDRWEVVSGNVSIVNDEFTLPASDVVIKAHFKPIVYTITLRQGSNGSATVSQTTGIIGDSITLTATPDENYNFSHWNVIEGGISVDGNSFSMPASNVVIQPVFVELGAVSSGFEYHSGSISGEDESRFTTIDVDFGEQPAGEYLINIYHWGSGCIPTFQISYNGKYLPFSTTGGVSTVAIEHDGGSLVLDGSLDLVKNLLQSAEGTVVWAGEFSNGNIQFHSISSWTFNIEDIVLIPVGISDVEDYGIYSSIVSFLKGQFRELISVFGSKEAEEDVDQAQESLNKEVEEIGQLSGDLTEQTSNLEQQFTTDFAVPDEVTGSTSSVQAIYDFLFNSLGIFSIFIWLPVVLAVIKKLLRL